MLYTPNGIRRRFAFLAVFVSIAVLATGCAPGFWGGFWEGYAGAGGSVYAYTPIDSYISSDFDGLQQGNIYVLANGQVWEQTEYYFYYHYAYRPRVRIYSSYGSYRMQVEGVNRAVTVVRRR